MIVHGPMLSVESLQHTAIVSFDPPNVVMVGIGTPAVAWTYSRVMVFIAVVMHPVDLDVLV
jgi:hypothetical protein